MAPRSFWRGYLKLSLVTCPVAMVPATSEAEKVSFHLLNRSTRNRVQSRYVDVETGKPLDEDDEVKGYEREEGEFTLAQLLRRLCFSNASIPDLISLRDLSGPLSASGLNLRPRKRLYPIKNSLISSTRCGRKSPSECTFWCV